MRTSIFLVALLACAGCVQYASAARNMQQGAASATAARSLPPWMPTRDAAGVWHPAANVTVDFSKLTLADLPSPEVFLQAALLSPFAPPQLPLDKILNNTFAKPGALLKLPIVANDWIKLLQNAGSFVTTSMPGFIQTALDKLLKGVSVNDKPLAELPLLANTTIDAVKALGALPQLLNITATGVQLPKLLAGGAVSLDLGLPKNLSLGLPQGVTLPKELQESLASLEELKKIPTLLAGLPKDLTAEELKKVPAVMQQIAGVASSVAEDFAKGLASVPLAKLAPPKLPSIDELTELQLPDLDELKAMLKSRVNIDLPDVPPMQDLLLNLTKTLPQVLSKAGLNVTLPAISADGIQAAFKLATKEGLFVQDLSGRTDVLATLSALPTKVPTLQKMLRDVFPNPKEWPRLEQSLNHLQEALVKVSSTAQTVLHPAGAPAAPAEENLKNLQEVKLQMEEQARKRASRANREQERDAWAKIKARAVESPDERI